MNQIAHQHHTLDPAEGPDLDLDDIPNAVDDEDEGPVVGSDAVALTDGEEPFD